MRYKKPEMEILELYLTDVITNSDGTTDGGVNEEGQGPSVDLGGSRRTKKKKGAGYEKREKINSGASGCHHGDSKCIYSSAGS